MQNKTIKTLVLSLCAASCFFLGIIAKAVPSNDPPPLAMLKNTADKTIVELDKHRQTLKSDDALVCNIVKRIALPHFDSNAMARSVVGREFWQAATPTIQKQFTTEFTQYIIRTYAAALANYNGEKIKFYPMRSYDASQNRAQVQSDILQSGGPAIPVTYRLVKTGSGDWLVYDFSVEGVSIIQNYRSQFSSTLSKSGLAGLVAEVHSHNQKLR